MSESLSRSIALVALAAIACAAQPTRPSGTAESTGQTSATAPKAAADTSPAPASADTKDGREAASVDVATTAAQSWLALVDERHYQESWQAAAAPFRAATTAENWAASLGAARDPLGKLISRQVRAAEYKTFLPGAPDGKYVVVQFGSVFENKAEAVETVTPVLEDDGSWRVSGYFIR